MSGLTITFLMASCTSSKLSQRSAFNIPNNVPVAHNEHGPSASDGMKFMEPVTISPSNTKSDTRLSRLMHLLGPKSINSFELAPEPIDSKSIESPEPNDLQVKYASILNIIPSTLSNLPLLKNIDDWFGTRYLYGGTTKRGIDCSAFTRVLFKAVYAISLPRTAREQYNIASRISSTELKEGDLLFFNTTGGVSHVGIYLNNNKFVHSSCSKGVTISDMFEPYYASHFIGARRIVKASDNYDVASR